MLKNLWIILVIGFATVCRAEYADEVTADEPEAMYRFNESAGATTLTDSTGNGHDSLSVSNVTFGATGPVDSAAVFSNGLVELDLQLDPSADDFSVETLIRFDAAGNVLQQLDGTGTGRAMLYRLSDGTIASYLGGESIESSTLVATGEWHHVVMTVEEAGTNDVIRFYIDGEAAGSGTADVETADGNWRIGKGNLAGAIDELAVYTNLLSAEQVAWHYETTVPLVDITNANETVSGNMTTVDVGGTNNAAVVGSLIWTNAANAANGTFQVSNFQFQVSNIPLALGANLISVSGTNAVGCVASDSITITRAFLDAGDSPIHYVSTNGAAVWPYTNWVTAATNIQDAVNTAAAGDIVLVTNGIYASSTQVIVSNAITLASVNGPEVTIVDGQDDHRCVYLGKTACVLTGFTLQNGMNDDGGGVYCSDTTSFITNCVITGNSGGNGGGSLGGTLIDCILSGNSAESCGGGSYGGTLIHCTLSGNTATQYGGGSYGGTLTHCTLTGNSAVWDGGGSYGGMLEHCILTCNSSEGGCGGGSYGGTLTHCTLTGNRADGTGGGSCDGTLKNCILWGNSVSGTGIENAGGGSISYSCWPEAGWGNGNIGGDPCFVDAEAGDYRLLVDSPCIDAGLTNAAGTTQDLDGNPFPLDGDDDGVAVPDMGAYEYFCSEADSDGDGLSDGFEKNTFGTSPVNPDCDDDSASDYDEYVAGTDPFDSSDLFRIVRCDDRTVWFQSSSSRVYTLLWCVGLDKNPYWGATREQTRIPGTGGIMSLTDPYDDPACYYRVQVEFP